MDSLKESMYSLHMTQFEFCTVNALDIGAPLMGTASANTSVWFLLEVPRPWAAKALAVNDLLPQVNETLQKWVHDIPKSNAVFIKKNNLPVESPKLIVALTENNDQRIHQFDLSTDYMSMADLPMADIVSGKSKAGQVDNLSPLFLVCTNGKRDNCCAKFGLPVIKAFEDAGDENVWQCTHLGGHRFAAVVGVFPQGLYYQLFNPANVPAFRESILQNQVPLQGLRGRTAYTGVEQAAEIFLREQSGNLDDGAYKLISSNQEDGVWQVNFQNGASAYKITLKQSMSEPFAAGCEGGKTKPGPIFELISIK